MDKSLELLGFYQILERLKGYAVSMQAKQMAGELVPFLSESGLKKNLRDTTQARALLDLAGTPPLPAMDGIEEYLDRAVKGDLLSPGQLESIGQFLTAVKRLKAYLERGKAQQISLAFYCENLDELEDLIAAIRQAVRGDRIDDYASGELSAVRRQLALLEEKRNAKAEQVLRANKACLSDSYVVKRNGRLCLPVKKEYKSKVEGSVIDKSSTGSTFFIEPKAVAKLQEEWELYKIMEDSEERRILYELTDAAACREVQIRENIRVSAMLDFIFAKGRMSAEMRAVQPEINLDRRIVLKKARHPLLDEETCVPLDFELGGEKRGMVITGPNTGGKTVAMKTVALLSLMACSGLHIPCEEGGIAMNCQVLCDIGDGQNIADNLSTFSAHITRVIEILKRANEESLVVLDELGSGTDPAEGMGIAIAILEELRKSKALFLATTHYPEVKEYAKHHPEIVNARMAFDRESLKPLYRLEMGKAGESCALYIAKRLGMPAGMLKNAAKEAYAGQAGEMIRQLGIENAEQELKKQKAPSIKRMEKSSGKLNPEGGFGRGDSVTLQPEGTIGIVVKPADETGSVLVQIKGEKLRVNWKRLKLKVAASELYPEDYDFSIIFDTAENRKAKHRMTKGYQKDLTAEVGDWES